MQSEYDPQREAQTAMKAALQADGMERQELIRIAQAWHELARVGSTGGTDPVTPRRGCRALRQGESN